MDQRIGVRSIGVYAADDNVENARGFINEARAGNSIRRQGDIYVVDDGADLTLNTGAPGNLDLTEHVEVLLGTLEDSVRARTKCNAPRPTLAREQQRLIDEALLGHYVEMYLRALEQQDRQALVQQARQVLGDDADADVVRPAWDPK
ncbi:hypothetical protein ACK280_25065 [Mycobacterium sherrisii]